MTWSDPHYGADRPTSLAFIGFGEAAQAFVEGWGGRRALSISAYDIKTDNPDAQIRDAKRADYARAQAHGAASIEEALKNASLVLSVVTADQAGVAAEAAAPFLADGVFYFDCNSCAPGTKNKAAAAIEKSGGYYVDTAVMAPVHPKLHRTPLLVSGPHAEEGAARLAGLGMNARAVDGGVGAAAAIKMIRSVMVKGLEALTIECLLAAVEAGVEEEVLASLEASHPGFDWRGKAAYTIERVARHGVRRAEEMREAALTINGLGLNDALARATAGRQEEIGALGVEIGDDGDYREAARAILDALARRAGKDSKAAE